MLLSSLDPTGEPGLFVARQVSAAGQQRLLIAEFAPEWLWQPAYNPGPGFQLLAMDGDGRLLSGSLENSEHSLRPVPAKHFRGRK